MNPTIGIDLGHPDGDKTVVAYLVPMNNIQQFAEELTLLSRKHGLILEGDIYGRVCVSPITQHSDSRYFVEEDSLEWLIPSECEEQKRAPQPLEPSSLREEQDRKLREEEARIREALKIPAEMRVWYEPK
jgi:hypothetical protein